MALALADEAAVVVVVAMDAGFLESPPSPPSALTRCPAVGMMTRLLGDAVVRWVMAGAGGAAAKSLSLELLLPLLSFLIRLLELEALESRAAVPVASTAVSSFSSSSGSDLTALRFLPVTAAAAAEARVRPLDLDRVVRLAPAAVVAVVPLDAAAVAADADERPLLAPPCFPPPSLALPSSAAEVRLAAFRARLPKAPALPRRDFPLPAPAAAAAATLSSWTAAAGSVAPVDDLVFLRVSMMMVVGPTNYVLFKPCEMQRVSGGRKLVVSKVVGNGSESN